jgi:hypothetical protein
MTSVAFVAGPIVPRMKTGLMHLLTHSVVVIDFVAVGWDGTGGSPSAHPRIRTTPRVNGRTDNGSL